MLTSFRSLHCAAICGYRREHVLEDVSVCTGYISRN
jgi:hypothetical protein